MASFGSSLRHQREAQGVPLEDIASSTRVSVRHLQALEADDFRALPGGVFNKGIVRSYARCLELDEDAVMQSFASACQSHGISDPGEGDWTEFAQNVSAQRRSQSQRARWAGVILMLLCVLAAAAAIYVVLMRRGTVPVPNLHRKGAEHGASAAQVLDIRANTHIYSIHSI